MVDDKKVEETIEIAKPAELAKDTKETKEKPVEPVKVPKELENVTKTDVDVIVANAVEEVVKNTEPDRGIFILENDRFEIKVRYHKVSEDSKSLFVEEIDDEFDPDHEDIKEISMTLKYPSQRDYTLIKGGSDIETVNDIFNLELIRIAILFRKWTYGTKVEEIDALPPNISKAIALQVRKVIKYDGIL